MRAGTITLSLSVAVLLLVLGADVIAAAWVLLALPLASRRVDAGPPAAALPPRPVRLLAGVMVAMLVSALYLLAQRIDWLGLPAGAFRAGTADLGGRLLTSDALVAVGLALAWVVLAAHRRPQVANEPEGRS
jgi:hypothetical protein